MMAASTPRKKDLIRGRPRLRILLMRLSSVAVEAKQTHHR